MEIYIVGRRSFYGGACGWIGLKEHGIIDLLAVWIGVIADWGIFAQEVQEKLGEFNKEFLLSNGAISCYDGTPRIIKITSYDQMV